MPDALAVTVAKAVTTALAGASLSQSFTPNRSYADWDLAGSSTGLQLADADVLHVDVVLSQTEQQVNPVNRDELGYIVPVMICVRQRFGTPDENSSTGAVNVSAVDALMYLVQQIHELFFKKEEIEGQLAGYDWLKTAFVVAPVREHLREWRQFTGIITITFRMDDAP